jgi:hypothetical protein
MEMPLLANDNMSSHSPSRTTTKPRLKRVFIAAPMSGAGAQTPYDDIRNDILGVIDVLEHKYEVEDVYFAGRHISTSQEFTDAKLALDADLSALRDTDLFIFLYPEKVVSSALIEAGYALALKKPILVLVNDRGDLPYLFKQAEQVGDDAHLPKIRIRELSKDATLSEQVEASLGDFA